jgi:hypothetical protein
MKGISIANPRGRRCQLNLNHNVVVGTGALRPRLSKIVEPPRPRDGRDEPPPEDRYGARQSTSERSASGCSSAPRSRRKELSAARRSYASVRAAIARSLRWDRSRSATSPVRARLHRGATTRTHIDVYRRTRLAR